MVRSAIDGLAAGCLGVRIGNGAAARGTVEQRQGGRRPLAVRRKFVRRRQPFAQVVKGEIEWEKNLESA